MVLGVCAEECDEGWGAADGRSGGGAEPGADARWRLRLQLEFESWGKLQLALAAGSQQMNLLQTASGRGGEWERWGGGGGGAAGGGIDGDFVECGTTAAAQFQVGELVAVDVDYAAQVGFVGSGVSAAYVSSPASVGNDVNYVRRVSLNVGRVVGDCGWCADSWVRRCWRELRRRGCR